MSARKPWNHQPPLPLQVSPVFRWPWNISAIGGWFWHSWFLISERLILVGVAWVSWVWFQPPLEVTRELSVGWVLSMYTRNLVLMLLVAGGLHLYLYYYKRQQDNLRFDARPLKRDSRTFLFNDQVRDNMAWTLGSGVLIWTTFEVILFWAMANGHAPVLQWADNPLWFVALFFLIPIWESFYFYWIHRLLHVPILYRWFHAVHHRNVNVGPWSGLSMHPVEHILFLGSALIHFVIAAHPVHVLFHLQYFALTAVTTHAGFEGLVVKNKNRLKLGTFHHQMHHRYFECNYGSLEIPWDRWFGSFHDGTEDAHQRMKVRRQRQMQSS